MPASDTVLPKPLTYIPEVILKKRKRNEEWALKRREQLEQRKWKIKQDKKSSFKRAEHFIVEYRKKELDFIQMKRRGRQKITSLKPESKLLFAIRIGGQNSRIHPQTRRILTYLRLGRMFSGVFLMPREGTLKMLQKVEPYVTYGCPNITSIRDVIRKKGLARIEKQRVPLTDNNIIEEALGKYGILCIEDMVHQVSTVGPHFRAVTGFLCSFLLSKPPEGTLQGKKIAFKDGGDAGNRGDLINELIRKMN